METLTILGGEPTLHPHFPEIIADTLVLRDKYFPNAKVSVLSNATMIGKPEVRDALAKVDNNILKLDTIDSNYICLTDRPVSKYSVEEIIENMKAFEWILRRYPAPCSVWAAWGAIITKRSYLPGCVRGMAEIGNRYGARWFTAGPRSKAGHPHHPLYLRSDSVLDPFEDLDAYLDSLT